MLFFSFFLSFFLSCVFSVAYLTSIKKHQGVDAEFVDLGNIVGQDFDSTNLDQEFYDDLARRIAERIKECGNRVPVVTGKDHVLFTFKFKL